MSTSSTAITLRDRLGGRWAISWLTYAVIAFATAMTVAFDEPGSFGAWAAITAAAAGASCAVLLLADVTVLRNRRVRPVAPLLVLAVGMLVGLARAWAMVGMPQALGVDIQRSTVVVVVGSVLLANVTVVGAALLQDAIRRHRDQQAVLVARLASLREMTDEGAELADAMRDAAVAEMMTVLDTTRRDIDVPVGEMSADDRLALAAGLRRTVDEQLRPISHRLYAASRRFDPAPVRGVRAFRGMLTVQALFPLATALVMLVVSASFARYAVAPVLLAAITWGVLQSVVSIGARRPWLRRNQMLVGAVIAGVLSGAAIAVVREAAGGSNALLVALATAFVAGALTMFTGLVGTLLLGDAATARLAEEVDARQVEAMAVNRELARTSRDLAQYVHGTLQANLLTTALAVERAAQAGDDEAFARAVADARVALATEPMSDPDAPTLGDALERTADLWRGFVDVRIELDDDLEAEMAPGRVRDIARIVGEAVANARKHGSARTADVRVARADDGDLRVTVTDDGVGPLGGVKGMGSSWLDFIAPGAWSLAPGPGGVGARLEVRLPQAVPSVAAGGAA